jgi:FkbM family methyltransferase
MSESMAARGIGLIESLIGRRQLWRLGRLLYRHARRDGHNDPVINGEYALHRKLAAWASRRDRPLNVIDVGANVGYWSSHLLEACRDMDVERVNLWAFEPSVEIRRQLADRLDSPGEGVHITIRGDAVSDVPGQAAFDASPGITGIKHLLTDSMLEEGVTPSIDVPVTSLARVLDDEKIDIVDFVKSDVEGFDLSVLRGATGPMADRRIGLIQFEYNHCWISTRSFLRDVFDLVENLPYRVCKVVPGGLDAYDAWHQELETFFETNYVLVREDLLEVFDVRPGSFNASNTYECER